LSLSGGLDARTILAVIDSGQHRLKTMCMGIDGSLDVRCARQMAEATGQEFCSYTLDTAFLSRFEYYLDRMIGLTDGQYLSQCIVMPTLELYQKLGIDVLLRGHGGELMHMYKAYNYSLDESALVLRDDVSLEQWLFDHLRAYMLDGVDGPILKGMSRADLEASARQSLRECLQELEPIDSPVQKICHLFVNQRLRRETALSLMKIGSIVETRLPYIDNELIELLLAAPPELKLYESIQQHILRRHRPEFLRITNANTSVSVGAGKLARKLGTLRKRVLGKLGFRGYQPYERLGLWLRQELAPLVRKILLSDQCLERGIFEPDTVRSVVENHLEHGRNHTYLLMALMILERGQRLLIDGDVPAEAPAGAVTTR
jgi:asparagine synthetase B (glutamine-hydrolysing)